MTPEELIKSIKDRLDGTKTPEEISTDVLLALGLDPHLITPERVQEVTKIQTEFIAKLKRIKNQGLN
jgi:hypothetical protein